MCVPVNGRVVSSTSATLTRWGEAPWLMYISVIHQTFRIRYFWLWKIKMLDSIVRVQLYSQEWVSYKQVELTPVPEHSSGTVTHEDYLEVNSQIVIFRHRLRDRKTPWCSLPSADNFTKDKTHVLLKSQSHLVPCFYSNERGTTLYQELASLTAATARVVCSAQGRTVSTLHTAHCPTVPMKSRREWSHAEKDDFGFKQPNKKL